MSLYRSVVWFAKGLREYTKSGYESACKDFVPHDLEVQVPGRVFLVTGGNSGIGKATALEIAKRGGTVHLVCRDQARAEDARGEIIRESGNQNIFLHIVDLSDPKQIWKFVENFKQEHKLHVLINNAGCMVNKRLLTEMDLKKTLLPILWCGHLFLSVHEALRHLSSSPGKRNIWLEGSSEGGTAPQVATCPLVGGGCGQTVPTSVLQDPLSWGFLRPPHGMLCAASGVYILTTGLIPVLEKEHDPRVITVSSGGMLVQKLNTNDLQSERTPFDGTMVYAQNKRQQVVLTEQWAQGHPAIHFSSMHPGWADTPGVRQAMPGFHARFRDRLHSEAQGADTVLWLALSSAAAAQPSGRFFQGYHKSLGGKGELLLLAVDYILNQQKLEQPE
ncbi:dehydrogenase/reductase SDR family member 12 isoform X2 [Gorilla gorilla gorilla]|uniref:dehydrogenase/reductase SDR family member 12 isoform X2 n=1 Tax=Gorilla gorilla gorilla TaxID=9595 RepID=UPI00300B3C03